MTIMRCLYCGYKIENPCSARVDSTASKVAGCKAIEAVQDYPTKPFKAGGYPVVEHNIAEQRYDAQKRAVERAFSKCFMSDMTGTTESVANAEPLTLEKLQAAIDAFTDTPPLPPMPMFVAVKRGAPGYSAIKPGGVVMGTQFLAFGDEIQVAYIREDDVDEVLNVLNGDHPACSNLSSRSA